MNEKRVHANLFWVALGGPTRANSQGTLLKPEREFTRIAQLSSYNRDNQISSHSCVDLFVKNRSLVLPWHFQDEWNPSVLDSIIKYYRATPRVIRCHKDGTVLPLPSGCHRFPKCSKESIGSYRIMKVSIARKVEG